jgi:hypothetical protein
MIDKDEVVPVLWGFVLHKKRQKALVHLVHSLNNEFFLLSDLLGPSSMFFGLWGVQRLAMVSDLIVSLSWKKATEFKSSSLCYDFDT